MNNFKSIIKGFALTAALAVGGNTSVMAAESQEPIITFHTTVYDNAEVENAFHIYLGATENTRVQVDCGFGKVDTEVAAAVYNPTTQEIDATFISCSVSKEGMVRIYGDADLIDYVDFEGCYIDNISFPTLTEVSILNLSHNLIGALDLSHMTKLQALYLSDNPFDKSPLVVGNDKPYLTILDMNIVEHIDPSFSITGYPRLVSMSAYNNRTLPQIDPTHCPELMRLSIDGSPQTYLDVSQNPKLLILNISQTNITEIDLSHNPYLTEFYCTNNGSSFSDTKMTSVDVTHNPELVYLFISGNNLTDIDLSQNTKLTDLYAARNSFASIDLSHNELLYNLNLSFNNLNFATLPAPRPTFGEYNYMQKPLPTERSYKEGTEIDFSSEVLRENSITTAKLYRFDKSNPYGREELGADYFAYSNGKVTLKKEFNDSVYVEFYNTLFMDSPLQTEHFMVKNAVNFGKPNPLVNIGFSAAATTVKMSVGIEGASEENPVTFFVDFGKGELTEFTAVSATLPENANVTGKRAGANTIVYIPEGKKLTAFGVSQGRINTSDFSQATHLKELVINNTAMTDINLKWNNELTYLNLDNNALKVLDLTGENGRYEKNLLLDISAANNKLTSLSFSNHTSILTLNVSGNLLPELLIDRCYELRELYVANNRLTSLDLNDCMGLTTLDVSHNNLTSLPVPYYCPLENLNITYNDVTFANLAPVGSYETYLYAPQNKVKLPTKAPGANLSAYLYTDAQGQTTDFQWYKVDGTAVTDDQIQGSKGEFHFNDTEIGEVYCSMTHPAFPDFAGENTYRTTDVMAAQMPTNVFCSFTTTASSLANLSFAGKENGTTIYIDWKGDNNLTQYILKDTYTRYTAAVPANVEVKCYSYEEDDDMTVFSVDHINVSKLDASKMKQAITFAWSDANLGTADFKLPESDVLEELNLSNNGLSSSIDGTKYPKLKMLNLSGNNLTSIDLTSMPALQLFFGGGNKITQTRFNNPLLWNLGLESNQIATIDLSKLPALQQLYLLGNKLTAIDFSSVRNLRDVSISRNYFTIATLPLPEENFIHYDYGNQNPMDIKVSEGKVVDLSSQLERDGMTTTYRWFVGAPWFNEYGELEGNELIPGQDFTIEDGVTTFNIDINDIMCVMNNDVFPNLFLYTYLIDVRGSAVDEIEAEDGEYEYYTLDGVKVARPTRGIYIRKSATRAEKVTLPN